MQLLRTDPDSIACFSAPLFACLSRRNSEDAVDAISHVGINLTLGFAADVDLKADGLEVANGRTPSPITRPGLVMGKDDRLFADRSFGYLCGLDAVDTAGAVLGKVTANPEPELVATGQVANVPQHLFVGARSVAFSALMSAPLIASAVALGITTVSAFEGTVVVTIVWWSPGVAHGAKLLDTSVFFGNEGVIRHEKSPPSGRREVCAVVS